MHHRRRGPSTPLSNWCVRAGETLTLRFDTTLAAQRGRSSNRENQGAGRALTPTNPTTFAADLPVGIYFIGFSTKWNQGDVSLQPEDRRSGPQARPIALTG